MTTQNESMPLVPALTAAERRAIEAFYGAWQLNQLDLIDEACTPDWQDIPLGPGQVAGPQGMKDIIQYFRSIVPDVSINVHEIFGTHERAGVRAEIAFTHNHEVLGIPATGASVAVPLHEFHYLKAGKITHTWHLEDWFGLLLKSDAWPAK